MKVNKMILPLAVALVAMIAMTGCKKGVPKTTKLFGMPAARVGDPDPNINTQGLPGGENPNGQSVNRDPLHPEHISTTPKRLEDYIQNREALAAYTVHFKYDSYVVKDNEQTKLAAVAQQLANDMSASLLIEGNCDERGTDEYNRTLGEHRALALREALQKNGVDAGRVITISYGRDRPVDTGHSEAAHAKNRRGDFVLLHPK